MPTNDLQDRFEQNRDGNLVKQGPDNHDAQNNPAASERNDSKGWTSENIQRNADSEASPGMMEMARNAVVGTGNAIKSAVMPAKGSAEARQDAADAIQPDTKWMASPSRYCKLQSVPLPTSLLSPPFFFLCPV